MKRKEMWAIEANKLAKESGERPSWRSELFRFAFMAGVDFAKLKLMQDGYFITHPHAYGAVQNLGEDEMTTGTKPE